MKNFLIILLSVIIMAITGCGKADDKKEVAVSDTNSTESVTTATKEITTEHTTVEKENQTTKENVDSETDTTTKQTQPVTEESKEVTTVPQTIQSTEAQTQPQTEKKTEVQTQPQTEQPTKAPEPITTAKKYDIASSEYQKELKRLIIYYINQYRASEGHVALTEDAKASEFAQARSVQLLTNFDHDDDDIRALATEMKYGTYVDTKLYGMDGDPFYTPYGMEAIACVAGNGYFSADDVAKRIAGGFYRSKEHWYYVGGTMEVYETDTMYGIGVSYKGGAWYCSMYVLEPR